MQQEIHERKPNRFYKWIKIILIVYCLSGIGVYYLQEKILFHRTVIQPETAVQFPIPFKEVTFAVDKDTRLHLVQFTPRDSVRKGVVLYFHGNMDNVTRYAPFAENVTKNGYEIWMMDYPGYGKSTGTISEELLYEEALQVYKMARVNYAPDSIIIYGRSIGSGVAAQLASVRDCKRLILETPYYSVTSLFQRWLWMYPVNQMVHYRFPNYTYFSKITAPITVFHGTDDEVIPYSNAARLEEVMKKEDEFITIDGGRHNDLINFKEMKTKLDSVLN